MPKIFQVHTLPKRRSVNYVMLIRRTNWAIELDDGRIFYGCISKEQAEFALAPQAYIPVYKNLYKY